MAGELTELGLRLRREVEEALAAPVGGWVLLSALDERGDLAQLRQLEREVGALAASGADAGQLYAWLTAGFFGEPLARGSVPDADARRPLSEDGDGPPEDTADPDGGGPDRGGRGGGSPSFAPSPVPAGARSPASPPPPSSPSAPLAPAPAPEAPPARAGIKGLADLAQAARSGPLVLPPPAAGETEGWTPPAAPPIPRTANSVIGINSGAAPAPARGGWTPEPPSDATDERRPRAAGVTADSGSPPLAVVPPSPQSPWAQARVTDAGARRTESFGEAWRPPFSGEADSPEGGRTTPGLADATPDVRRSDASPMETAAQPRGAPAARGLAGLAALAGSRPLVLADEQTPAGGEGGAAAERIPNPPGAVPPPPAPPAPVAARGVAVTAGEGTTRVVRILPVPVHVAVTEERALPWPPAAAQAEGWTPPFADAPPLADPAPRAAPPTAAAPPRASGTAWMDEGDAPRPPRLAATPPARTVARGTGLATAVAAFAPRGFTAPAGQEEARAAAVPETAAPPPPPAVPEAVPPPVFSTTLASPAREGFGAAGPGEPPAWPDVEVGDLMEALAREIMHEYRRHYGA